MDIDRKMNILSGLKYHNYALLIAHVDAERFSIDGIEKKGKASAIGREQEGKRTVFDKPMVIFTEQCQNYRRNLNVVLDEFMKASNLHEKIDFGPFMYNPSCFVAFGDNDNVSFVAVDEFDAAARLSSLEDLPVRQTCLAFCPELESLGLKDNESKNIFCELTDIYKRNGEEIKQPMSDDIASFFERFGEEVEEIDFGEPADPSPFFEKRPLMAVTYFKLDGMAVLGPGLMIQEYVYKVMADRIKRTLKGLSDNAGNLTDILPSGKDDIDSFRCMFLDPQGWSDVATLMFCQNYSVISTVIAALRFITLGELYEKSTEEVQDRKRGSEVALEEAVRCSGVHEALARKVGNKTAPRLLLSKNHVFCSAYSTLSIYDKAFDRNGTPEAGEPYHYNGVVMAETSLNVCSGHVLDMRETAKKREEAIAEFQTRPETISAEYLWCLVGHNDVVYQQLADERRGAERVVNLAYLVRQIKSIWKEPKERDGARHSVARDILDLSTDLRIPIPLLPESMRQVDSKEHIEIRRVLETLRRDLFEAEGGRFNLNTLSNSMNMIRIPSPLSTAIGYLYTDLAYYLTDLFLFESVLDLYDIFTALYRLLVEELPKSLKTKLTEHLCKVIGKDKAEIFETLLFEVDGHKNGEDNDGSLENLRKKWQIELEKKQELRSDLDSICLNFLGNDDIENLVELKELMRNALSNRVQIAFREAERWNVTVDARGIGLDRIMSAADVPLKCGLGLLRRVMNKKTIEDKEKEIDRKLTEEEKEKINTVNRTRIGGASKITYNPRAFSKRLVVGDNQDIFLASVDLNIAHLTRPRALYIHLHETAHMISYLLRDQEGCQHPEYQCAVKNKCCHKKVEYETNERNDIYLERYQEIFTEMLIHRFVFVFDHDLFFRNYMANYSLDPIAFTGNDDYTTKQMTEVFIRGFLASEPYRRENLYTEPCELTEEVIEKVWTDFWNCVEGVGPFFYEYCHLWCGPKKEQVKYYIQEQFKRIYKNAYHPVCCIWKDVKRVFRIVTQNDYPSLIDQRGGKKRKGLDTQIAEGIKKGRPLVRVQYRGRLGKKEATEDTRLDPLYLISRLLDTHISNLYANIDTEKFRVYLRRKTNGSPDALALEKNKRWNLMLLDRNFNGVVAADPWTRRKSIRNRIAIIKTLWDISTNLRARRMKDMLSLTNK